MRKISIALITILVMGTAYSLFGDIIIRSEKPNILWIYVEDMNDWMGAYGDDTVPTPNIDRLAAKGVRFDNAIMPSPVCSVTRSAIITGVMASNLGLHNHRSSRAPSAQIYLPPKHKTIPELFRQAGYVTFNQGKDDYNFAYQRQKLYSFDPGADKMKKQYEKSKHKVKAGKRFKLKDLPRNKPFFGQIQLNGGKDKAKPIVKVSADSVAGKLPPYYPNAPSFRKAWARHYEQIAITDWRVGKIIEELKAAGLYENTVIFFFTDHGMVLPRHKQFLYEGGIRVPLVVSWAGNEGALAERGKVRADIVNGIDIGTSSLAIAGINIPKYMEGDDVFDPHYEDKAFTIATRDRLDYTFDRIRTVRGVRYKYIRNFFPERAYLQPQYRDLHPKAFPFMPELRKLQKQGRLSAVQEAFLSPTRPIEELYDLQNDPHETKNLAGERRHRKVLKEYREVLEDWIRASDDKGEYPESDVAMAAIIGRWGDICQSPECRNYRLRHGL